MIVACERVMIRPLHGDIGADAMLALTLANHSCEYLRHPHISLHQVRQLNILYGSLAQSHP